ncbi:hypothetical protein PJF56_02575 [Roseofilum sp. BLCC_M91]|jgi:hypothetical protein|uniref:CopG family transcriptional regulator n=1 Tax=Roseofilum halophilum BLCC-M91 TaxID=3022259 RepID=A0ABT7BG24_9CYAN|nr:hypothetical protein [Roseofilum halophilum]MDJ1177742.1 hypothetical protein [Roseofilum halophilum BLCC-M91]
MQDKQKVTLYIPPELHRRLKIQAAVDLEPMSAIVERAVSFYLEHPEVVENINDSHGKTYQIHTCPECKSSVVINDGELVALKNQPTVLSEEELPVERVSNLDRPSESGEEELVPC